MDGITKRLANFIVNTDYSQIPDEIYEHAKCAFMDYLAVAMEGADEPLVKKLVTFSRTMGGNEQATVLGRSNGKMSISQAALINGGASHALDYDDSLASFFGHPTVTLFPAIMALSEWNDKSGREFLVAYLVGLQVGAVIGTSAGKEHYMKGWHATSTIGHFASAAACANLLGLTVEQTVNALGIAGTRSAGLKRMFGTMCKPYHAGMASEAGLIAALLAKDDFTSAADVLEGEYGFFHCCSGAADEAKLNKLGQEWDVVDLAQKYHASCHATHSPIEVATSLVDQHNIDLYRIESINIGVSKLALDAAGISKPTSGLEGKFSIAFCVANALVFKNTDQSAFTDERVVDPEIVILMDKINVYLDEDVGFLQADLSINLGDCEGSYQALFDVMEKIPSLLEKREKIGIKFHSICSEITNEQHAEKLGKAILDINNTGSMKKFVSEIYD